MRTALVLGSASCLAEDVSRAGPFDGVLAVNDAAVWWPGELDAVVSYHPEDWPRRLALRAARGYPPPRRVIGFWWPPEPMPGVEWVEWEFPGGSGNGSSALFAVKVALVDLGFDRVTLCGVPLTVTDHITGAGTPFLCAPAWRQAWINLAPKWRKRIRSMSGWTRDFLEGRNTVAKLRNTTDMPIELPTRHIIPAFGEIDAGAEVMTYPDNRRPLEMMLANGDLVLVEEYPTVADAVDLAPEDEAPKRRR